MHVDEDEADLGGDLFGEDAIHGAERILDGVHERAADEVDHRVAAPVAERVDPEAAARSPGGVVERAQDARVLVEGGVVLAVLPGVVRR